MRSRLLSISLALLCLSALPAAAQSCKSVVPDSDLVAAGKPKPAPTATGPVPAYLSSEIANYQAGLNRLTGGQTASSGSGTVGLASLFS